MSRALDVFNIDPADIVKLTSFQVNAIESLADFWRFKGLSESQHTRGRVALFQADNALLTIATNGVVRTTEKPIWTNGAGSGSGE